MIGSRKSTNSTTNTTGNKNARFSFFQRRKKAEGKANKGISLFNHRNKKNKDSSTSPPRKKEEEWWSSDEGSKDTSPSDIINKNVVEEEGEEVPLEQAENVLCSLMAATVPLEEEVEVVLEEEEARMEPPPEKSCVVQVEPEKHGTEPETSKPTAALPKLHKVEGRDPQNNSMPPSTVVSTEESVLPKPELTPEAVAATVPGASTEQPQGQKQRQQQFRILILVSTTTNNPSSSTQQQRALKSPEDIITFTTSLQAARIPFEVLHAASSCSDTDDDNNNNNKERQRRVDELLQISAGRRPHDTYPQFFLVQPSRPTTFLGDWDTLARGNLFSGQMMAADTVVPSSTGDGGGGGATVVSDEDDNQLNSSDGIWSSTLKDHVRSNPDEPAVLDVTDHHRNHSDLDGGDESRLLVARSNRSSGSGGVVSVAEQVSAIATGEATDQYLSNDKEGDKVTAALATAVEAFVEEAAGANAPSGASFCNQSDDEAVSPDVTLLSLTLPAPAEVGQKHRKNCQDCQCAIL